MQVTELTRRYLPECHGQPQETWLQHAHRLWRDEPTWMTDLTWLMRREGRWLHGPVIVDDGYVQDGHHRVAVALALGWTEDIPIKEEQG